MFYADSPSAENSELMKILMKKRELEMKKRLETSLHIRERANDTTPSGGQLYKIIKKDLKVASPEDEVKNPLTPEISEPSGYATTAGSFLFPLQEQPSRDSSSSVNSFLSRHSLGRMNASFSSYSGDSVTSSEGSSFCSKDTVQNQWKYKPKKPPPVPKRPSPSSTVSSESALWKPATVPGQLQFVEGKTTSDNSDVSSDEDEAMYYSIDASDDNNNIGNTLSESLEKVTFSERLPQKSRIDFHSSSTVQENIYECINYSSVSSLVRDSDKCDSSTVASDEYGSDIYEEIDKFPVIAAVNRQFSPPQAETKADNYKRKLSERINELVVTEGVYVGKLRHIVRDYMPLLEGEAKAYISSEQVFCNVRQLYKFHSQELLPALKQAQNDVRAIGKIFRQFEDKLMMYVKYSKNNKNSNRLVFDHRFFFKAKQTELGKRLDLSSYLLEPIQRIPRYLLFLDELVKTQTLYDDEVNPGHRDLIISAASDGIYENVPNLDEEREETALQSLQAAKKMMQGLLRKIDNTIAIANIKQCQTDPFKEGELLRQDEFYVTDSFKKRYHMRCFLFEKSIIFTKVCSKTLKEEIFEYHDIIRMGNLGITPPEDDSAPHFTVWQGKRTNKPYIMETTQSIIKKAWVHDISDLLWKQAYRDKEKLQSSKRYSKISLANSEASNSSQCTAPAMNGGSQAALAHLTDSSLRGVPGEIQPAQARNHRTTWYVE